jgi:ATP-dependent DNA helicase RecG
MRPSILDPLFAGLGSLGGVGPKSLPLYRRLLGTTDDPLVVDLLFHLPTGVIDWRARPLLRDVQVGQRVTVEVVIDRHRPAPPGRKGAPHRVQAHDETGDLTLVFFRGDKGHLERLMPVGAIRYVSGIAELYDGVLQMVHPDRIVDADAFARQPLVEPVYPMTEGLHPGRLRTAVAAALARVPVLPDWLDPAFRAARRFPDFGTALSLLHRPDDGAVLDPAGAAWSRLAYDEMLASQLALAMVRERMRRIVGRRSTGDGRLTGRLMAALPFSLTGSQDQAIADIRADLAGPDRMLRLLQGDVGSGKTVVALFAMAIVVEAGRQAALMAPTEILARQHHKTMAPLCAAAGLRLALLTGREKGRERAGILSALSAGEIDIVVGTHALFQDDVAFRDLALAVVDEQHRFGVHQRLALARKGEAVDLLIMTATPIPRTLVLSFFGDMDVSRLTEKPAGRKPIDTRLVGLDRLDEVMEAVGRAIAAGTRVYWVCPLIEESAETDLAAAGERFAALTARYGEAVDLIHGRMKGADKDAAMTRFAAGQSQVLVATTVIEVGVDVPEATVMVIEHAERFGLAQLHQLRGRVGRGGERSTCILLYKGPLGETARARLTTLRDTEDGFLIAETDLRLRGEGDVLGTRQSGQPGGRLVRYDVHGALLEAARDDARLVLTRDPDLAGPRGEALRVLLYLFRRDAAVGLLRAG